MATISQTSDTKLGAGRTAIIGGGMLGLCLALRLAQRGERVTVFEAAPELGGLASVWKLGDLEWDRHYHVTLYSDVRLRALLAELGLENELVWSQAQTGFYTDGKFSSMNGLLEFLRFPPLNLLDKFRLGITILRASRIRNPAPLERIPVETWLRRWSGKRTFEKIWRPLLLAKLGERYRDASAAFIWAIIVRLYAARRAGLGAERFGYVRGGYARVLAALGDALLAAGVEIRTGTPVERVARGENGVDVTPAGARALPFDRAVVTLAAPLAARICQDLDANERARLSDKVYGGILCASVVLDDSLGPYYVNNLTDAWVPFSAIIEMSALVDKAEFGGRALVYLPKYVAPDDPIFEEDDAAIEARFLGALERIYPHFRREGVKVFRISRVRNVFAIATLGYSDRVPPIATSVPGLYLATSAHIVNGTLNVNETVMLAERALETIGARAEAVNG